MKTLKQTVNKQEGHPKTEEIGYRRASVGGLGVTTTVRAGWVQLDSISTPKERRDRGNFLVKGIRG
jgi:hypothetical protein